MSYERSENVRMMLNTFQNTNADRQKIVPRPADRDCRRGSDRVRDRRVWGTDIQVRGYGQSV